MRLRRIIEPDYAGVFYRKEKYEHNPELMDAYECGYEDAMREMGADGYHERRGNVTHYGAEGRILYRHDPEYDREMWDDGEVEYRRRRRNSRGEFI